MNKTRIQDKDWQAFLIRESFRQYRKDLAIVINGGKIDEKKEKIF